MLPPGKIFDVLLSLPGVPTQEEMAALRKKETVLCAYGFVEYEDAFGRKGHVTRVGYVYEFAFGAVLQTGDGTILNPPGFKIMTEPEYNRAT